MEIEKPEKTREIIRLNGFENSGGGLL